MSTYQITSQARSGKIEISGISFDEAEAIARKLGAHGLPAVIKNEAVDGWQQVFEYTAGECTDRYMSRAGVQL